MPIYKDGLLSLKQTKIDITESKAKLIKNPTWQN